MNSATKNRERLRQLLMLAMLSAIAFLVMWFFRVPLVPGFEFLKYDPKDVVIAIGGFIYGPPAALAISVVVSLLEMVTVSSSGPIGLLMNVLSTVAFACTASVIYKRKNTMAGAIVGLVAGALAMTGVMLLWNYFITPMYTGMPRADVGALLVPVFLPFNLIKASLNAVITLLLYKPLVTALRRAKMIPESKNALGSAARPGYMIIWAVVLISLVVGVFVFTKLGG